MTKSRIFPWMLTATLMIIVAVPAILYGLRGRTEPPASLFEVLLILAVTGAAAALAWVMRGMSCKAATRQELVPEDFKRGLDGLSEAVLALDYNGAVAFCNRSFLQLSGHQRTELDGLRVKGLSWFWIEEGSHEQAEIPWLEAVKSGRSRTGRIRGWPAGSERIFVMNSVSVAVENERPRGALISLLDVTRLHQKQNEMAAIMSTIRESSLQIRHQQAEIEELALRDPLTGCFHRRYGMECLTRLWKETVPDGEDLACLLIDVDHLQLIVEAHGQGCADRALQQIAAVILGLMRPGEVACRYDGDEFLVLLPRTDAMEAVRRAESLRQEISRMKEMEEVSSHVSIGIACRSDGPGTQQELLSRAAARLAQAKEEGRNRVCWIASRQSSPVSPKLAEWHSPEASRIIPYAAVTALISALSYRDYSTASHSRRVADLCVALGQRLMSMSSCYVLEMSALLHDIGKIGVPDSLLHKAAPLTDEEWSVMHTHDEMGVEIVRTAFAHPELTEIVENYSRRFDDSLNGIPLPLGARILAVADAYDSMTTAQVYRPAMTPGDAVAELRRCAGMQFDPEIVSHFAEVILLRNTDSMMSAPMPREAALAIGLELERLSTAVDLQDLDALKKLAAHLAHVAGQLGAPEISLKAVELELVLKFETDRVGILQCANELLNHCRATQATYTSSHRDFSQPALAAGANPARQLSAIVPLLP